MPKQEELCEVRTKAGVYKDWLTVACAQTYGSGPNVRQFTLTLAEPTTDVLKIVPRNEVEIRLAGQVYIQKGLVSGRQVGFDAYRHLVQVDGLSVGEVITESALDPPSRQFKSRTFKQIASDVLSKKGLRYIEGIVPSHASLPFSNVNVHYGETLFAFLGRLALARGIHLSTDKSGNLVGGATSSGTVALEEGVNILSCSSSIISRVPQNVIVSGQNKGSDDAYGRKASEISATSKAPNGTPGVTHVILAEERVNKLEAQARADMEMGLLQLAEVQLTVVHQGWIKPGGSALWELGDAATVKSARALPTLDGALECRVLGVTMTQNEGGTQTKLELGNDKAYSLRFPQDGNPYEPAATKAVADAEV